MITRPTDSRPLAKARETEPVLQVAMRKEEVKSPPLSEPVIAAAPAPKEVDLKDDRAALFAHSEDSGIAASKPLAAKGIMARSTADLGADQLKLKYCRKEAKLVQWSSSVPEGVTVQYYPTLIEADKATRELKKDCGKQAEQWTVRIINPLDHAVTASMDCVFSDMNWSVSVSDPAVIVTTRDPRIVQLRVEVPPAATKVFHCTTLLPVEPAQGDDP